MYIKTAVFVLLFTAVTVEISAQPEDVILGKTDKLTSAAVYDLSDPTGVNIEVNMWGFVGLPGRYRVPVNTTFLDLMSYSGGPLENSDLKEIRILRKNLAGKSEVIKLNYDDLLWEEQISSKVRSNPILLSGDIVIIKRERRFSFREDVGFYLPIFGTLISIATFIITITRN